MTSNQNNEGGNNEWGKGGRNGWDGRKKNWGVVPIGSWECQINADEAEAKEVRNTVSKLLGVRANLGGKAFISYVFLFVRNSLHRPMRRNEMLLHYGWITNLDENGLLPCREYWEQRESNVRRARSEGQDEQQGEEGL